MQCNKAGANLQISTLNETFGFDSKLIVDIRNQDDILTMKFTENNFNRKSPNMEACDTRWNKYHQKFNLKEKWYNHSG